MDVTLRFKHRREFNHNHRTINPVTDSYNVPLFYDSGYSQMEEKEMELKLGNVTGFNEGDLEKMIGQLRGKMLESLIQKPRETIRLLPTQQHEKLRH